MNIENSQSTLSPTKKKLISRVLKHYPNLNEKELSNLLRSVKRFVNLIKRLQTEPQVQIVYKESNLNGRISKQRVINTDIEEVVKVMDEPFMPIKEVMARVSKQYPEKKYGRRPKKV